MSHLPMPTCRIHSGSEYCCVPHRFASSHSGPHAGSLAASVAVWHILAKGHTEPATGAAIIDCQRRCLTTHMPEVTEQAACNVHA